jgi:hypothetical protein
MEKSGRLAHTSDAAAELPLVARWGGGWGSSMLDMHTPLSLYLRQWISMCVVTYLLT